VRTEQPDVVRSAIHRRTLEVCGLPPRDVMLVQPGSLPKTSSGKLQRAQVPRAVPRRGTAPRVRFVYTPAHLPARSLTEIEQSGWHTPWEHVGRAEAIRETLVADGSFTLVGPDEWGWRRCAPFTTAVWSTSSPARGRSTSSSTGRARRRA